MTTNHSNADYRRLDSLFIEKYKAEIGECDSRWFYLSFADERKGFLGACFVHAFGPTDAIVVSYRCKCNPGGDVMIVEVPKEAILPPENVRHKLLSFKDLEALGLSPREVRGK